MVFIDDPGSFRSTVQPSRTTGGLPDGAELDPAGRLVERQLEARNRRLGGGGRNPDRRVAIDLKGEGGAARLGQILDRKPVETGFVRALDCHDRIARRALRVYCVEPECQPGLMIAGLEMTPAALADAGQLWAVVFVGNASRKPAAPGGAESPLKQVAQVAAERIVGRVTIADLDDPQRVVRLTLLERAERGKEGGERVRRRKALLDRWRRWRRRR